MSRSRLLIGIVIVSVLSVAGYFAYFQYLAPAPVTPTPAGAPTAPPTPDVVSAEGVLVPARHAALAFWLSGRVAEVLVAAGDTVAAGQPLLRLESAELRAAVAQAAAGVAQAQAAIAQAEAAAAAALAGVERAEAAQAEAEAARGLVAEAQPDEPTTASELQLEQAQARLAQAEAGVRQADALATQAQAALDLAQAGLEAARAALALAEAQLAQATLTAPFTGTVARVNLEAGEIATPAAPAVILADLSRWHVETVDLAESDVALVRPGQPATITLDALPGTTVRGTVTEISMVAETNRGNVTYRVTIALDGADARWRWGLTAFVDLGVGE